jgi:hypothetical protein
MTFGSPLNHRVLFVLYQDPFFFIDLPIYPNTMTLQLENEIRFK